MRATIHSFLPTPYGMPILGQTDWAIISAERPPLPGLSARTNDRIRQQRTGHLRRNLSRFGLEHWAVVGVYAGVREHSSLVIGITEQEAVEVGRLYEQDAVLVPRGLIDCRTAHLTPAVAVVSLPPSTREDHTHVFATGATFAVRFAAAESQPQLIARNVL